MEERTTRITISTSLFVAERPNAVAIPEAHEEVSSVVVLQSSALRFLHTVTLAYSFAKTPLKAAQAPLAAASGIQGSLAIVVLFDGSG